MNEQEAKTMREIIRQARSGRDAEWLAEIEKMLPTQEPIHQYPRGFCDALNELKQRMKKI